MLKLPTSLKKSVLRTIYQTFGNLKWSGQPDNKVDGLNATDDGKSSEESHGASNETQLGLKLDLLVSLNVVEGRRVKVDLHQLKCGLKLFPWGFN